MSKTSGGSRRFLLIYRRVVCSALFYGDISQLVKNNIRLSKYDWDSFETSWDFQKNPLLTYKQDAIKIEESFNNWSNFTEQQFNQLKQNEEELNRIFIEIYGLQDELTHQVKDKDITINKADRERDIKFFILCFRLHVWPIFFG